MRIETAAWDDPEVQRLTADQQVEIRAFGAYVGDPDATDSLFFERTVGGTAPAAAATAPGLPGR